MGNGFKGNDWAGWTDGRDDATPGAEVCANVDKSAVGLKVLDDVRDDAGVFANGPSKSVVEAGGGDGGDV